MAYVMANVPVSPVPEDHEAEMDGLDAAYMPSRAYTSSVGASGDKYENAMASLAHATEERNLAHKEAAKLRQELSATVAQVEMLQVRLTSRVSSEDDRLASSLVRFLLRKGSEWRGMLVAMCVTRRKLGGHVPGVGSRRLWFHRGRY